MWVIALKERSNKKLFIKKSPSHFKFTKWSRLAISVIKLLSN